MRVIVNPHKIELIQEEAVNEKEIDISKCEFEFDDEITDDYVKEAYFTLGDTSYKKIIVNNKCDFPQEVLVKPATIELGVVAYLVEDETEIKRYNPTPVYFKTDLGSLKIAENSEEPTPSEMEQYEQALQDGLAVVNGKLTDINEAITETNNLNIDANKVDTTTTITLTKKDGTTKTVQVLDGEKGETGDRGPQGIQGPVGQTGPAGRDGTNGTDGVDGVSPIATVSKSNGTATITITDKNGTTTATVSDGQDGINGTNGRDGYVQYTAGDNITISDNTISATVPQIDLSNYYTKSEVDSKVIYGGRVSENDAEHRISLNEIEPGIHEYWADRNGSSYYSEQYLGFKATINGTTKLLALMVPSRMDDKKIINDMVYVEIKNKVPETVTGTIEVGRFFYDYVNSGSKRVGKISKTIYASTSGLSTYDDNSQNFELYMCDLTSSQIITGKKTYTTLPESDYAPTNNKQFANKKYVDDTATQVSTMPTASSTTVGKIVQYTGTTDSTYTNGYFYIGVTDGQGTPTYSWENINVQPSSGGSSQSYVFDFDFDKSNYYLNNSSYTFSATEITKLKDVLNAMISAGGKYLQYGVLHLINTGLSNQVPRDYYLHQETNYNIAKLLSTGGLAVFTGYFTENGNHNTWDDYDYAISRTTLYVTFTVNSDHTAIDSISQAYIRWNAGTLITAENTKSFTPTGDYNPAHKKYVDDKPTTYAGYDATKTQVLKNIQGVLTWVDE